LPCGHHGDVSQVYSLAEASLVKFIWIAQEVDCDVLHEESTLLDLDSAVPIFGSEAVATTIVVEGNTLGNIVKFGDSLAFALHSD